MQTRQYKDLFALSTHLIGAVELVENEQDQLASFINRRYFEAFRKSPFWPRYVVYGEPRELIALTVANASGTGATFVNGNYILLGSQKSGGTGHALTGSSIYCNHVRADDGSSISDASLIYEKANGSWVITTAGIVSYTASGLFDVSSAGTTRYTELDASPKSFPYEVNIWSVSNGAEPFPDIVQKQSIPYVGTYSRGEVNTIGDFQRIHKQKPFLNNSASEYDFSVDFEGANILNILNTDENVAYVTYKKQFTPFTVNSDYYNSTVEVPSEFFNYIAHAAYADFLTLQGKVELAQAESVVAEKYLDLELEKLSNINSTNTLSRISTHLSRQSRK